MIEKIRLLSLNVRGLTDIHKRNKLLLWVNNQKPDIVCFQETYCTESQVEKINETCRNFDFDGHHSITDSAHSRGTSILIKKKSDIEIRNVVHGKNGRKILLNLSVKGNMCTLVNIYAPNNVQERCNFCEGLGDWIYTNASDIAEVIVTGDFNCALNDNDRFSRTNLINRDKSRKNCKHLINK